MPGINTIFIMLQRIQTLFLAVAAGLIFSLFLTPMMKIVGSEATEIVLYREYTPFLIIIFVAFVLCVTTIVSYKRRIFQIRLCNLNSLILLGFQIWIAVQFFTREPQMVYSVTALFPIVAAVMTFFAMRYIARDEALVMASSRLRSRKK